MGFHHFGQAGLKLLSSGDPSALASQSAGITSMSHHTWPLFLIFDEGKWRMLRSQHSEELAVSEMDANGPYRICLLLLLRSKGLALLPRLEYSAVISAHYNVLLLGSSDSPATASRVAENTGIKDRVSSFGQAGLEFLTSSDPPTEASQIAENKGLGVAKDRSGQWQQGPAAEAQHCSPKDQ
ncbi:hypothetical protein AAY473_016402, partial [Plecturocebus cupreus]